MARFTPVTTLTSGSLRSRLRTAIRQEPLARSTNTTAGCPATAAITRSSSATRSQPLFETGMRAPVRPLICSAACTSAAASGPWHTTTPRSSSLIVLLEVLLDPTLFLHALDEASIECRGHIHSGIAQEVHHRDHLRNHRDILAGVERDHDPWHRHLQNGGLLPS